MKTRNGLVSNSSSSSFLIYGAEITDDMKEKIKKLLTPKENAEDDDSDSHYELSKAFEYGTTKFGVDYIVGCGGDSAYLGLSWGSVGDDETGKQFKDKIEKAIESIIGEKIKCSTHDEAWNDC